MLCLRERFSFANEPAENGHHRLVAPQNEAFRMPLYTQYSLMLTTFHSLDDAVGTYCRDTQMRSGFAHSLVVERVDSQFVFAKDAIEQASFLNTDCVRGKFPRHILRMLKFCSLSLDINILIDFSVQGSRHHLYTATDTQHWDLAVECFASQEEFSLVALRTDTM